MADYNIYIHSMGGEAGGPYEATQPWKENGGIQTIPWGEREKSTSDDGDFKLSPKKAVNSVKALKSMAKAGKFGPIVAAAYAVIKGSQYAVKTADSFIAPETGDYRFTRRVENYNAVKQALFHPIQTAISHAREQQSFRLEEQRREQQRSLLGDSEINRYTNRGV